MINEIKKIITDYKSFFYLYLLLLVVVGVLLLVFTKEETFMFVNRHFAVWADPLFKGITALGDGLFFALVTLTLALYRYRLALLGLIIFLGSSLLAQLLKHTFFSSFKRPYGVFGPDAGLHIVDGVSLHTSNSFPSGHTTTAFALALFIVMAFNIKKNGWLLVLVAALVGYSRVYLVQHFPVDAYFGSMLGVISSLLLFVWLNEPFKRKFGNKGLIAKS